MPQADDLVGQVFGRLTVLSRDPNPPKTKPQRSFWICQCECGNIKSYNQKYLKNGDTRSCGCAKQGCHIKDLTGKVFGRLTVLSLDKERMKDNPHTAYWLCQCECGNITSVEASSLTRKNKPTRSCGCYMIEVNRESRVVDLTGKKIGKLTVLERDDNDSRPGVHWKCRCECGNIKTYSSDCLLKKDRPVQSCGCVKSYGELAIRKILLENNIEFETEKTFPDLGKLRYDFYLPKQNRLIEFDGEQHYRDYNDNSSWGRVSLAERQARDKFKNKYALDNQIQIIRIPYWEKENLNLEMLLGDKFLITKL